MKAMKTIGSKIEAKQIKEMVTVIQIKQAASLTTRGLFVCALAAAVVTNFVACQPNGAQSPNAPGSSTVAQQSSPQGPGGTGGGNVVLEKSTIAEVEAMVDREYAILPQMFTGGAIALNPFYIIGEGHTPTVMSDFARLFATTPENSRLSEIASEILAGGVTSKPEHPVMLARIESILPFLKLEKRPNKPCDDTVKEHHDGSAHQMTICVSLQRLTRIPQSALKIEVRALLAHEFMHVLNYGESDAQLMQRYFIYENTTSKVSRTAKIVAQFYYESGYAKFVTDRPDLNDPNYAPFKYGYLDWTRDAHLHFVEQFSPLLENEAIKAAWLPRINAKRDRMQRLANELVGLALVGADPENKKLAVYEELAAEWVDAQKMAIEIAAINFNPATSKLDEK